MRRALVLSGGGPVGAAWESGLLAGLALGGVDVGRSDFILGTSSGAIVGARLAAGKPAGELADALLSRRASDADRSGSIDGVTFGRVLALMAGAQMVGPPSNDVLREIGALSLASQMTSEAAFLELIGRGLYEAREATWPGRYACTAVDVEDGKLKLWDAGAAVGLVPAVTSSCSVPGISPPITLNGRRYMDGGMRSATNADLAIGFDLVVVVSVQLPGAPAWMAERLDEEVRLLESKGARVAVIQPDGDSRTSLGGDPMTLARDAAIARAGLAQGRAQAEAMSRIWS